MTANSHLGNEEQSRPLSLETEEKQSIGSNTGEKHMTRDEEEIRDLVATWMQATREGDGETVLGLMADDARFIVPGQPPFGKEAFAAAAEDPAAAAMEIDSDSEILEITVAGEYAFMLAHLTVTVKSAGKVQMVRAGGGEQE